MDLLLVWLHVVGNLVWIGAILAVGVTITGSAGDPKTRGEIALGIYKRLAVPAFPDSYGPRYVRERSRTRARRRLTLGRVVPMSRVLVTGMSGTGKSSALAELGRRGYRVVDTGDPGWREYREYVESSDELHRGEWLWVEERITGLLDSDDGRSLFLEGCVRNQSKFYDRFNAVVLLSAPADVDP